MSKVFTRRALNRATLQRQMLLRREDVTAAEAVERLAGLNAQDPRPPYLSLWARLAGFELDDLTKLLYDRSVIRSSMMRGTQHMVAAQDFLAWRPLLQPLMSRLQRFFGKATTGVDLAELAAMARELLAGGALTRPELGRLLAERWPSAEPGALGSSVQFLVPLIHPPPSGTWGKWGATPFVLGEEWIGRPMTTPDGPQEMIKRYLAAFGPSSVKDIQAWSGLTRLREPVEALGLQSFSSGDGQVLYDLPDAPRPDPDTPAPVRFLPEVDNLLTGHADRTRIMTTEVRQQVCIGAVIKATVLVDGFVHGIWSIKREGGRATLEIELFHKVDPAILEEEGMRLLAFAASDTGEHDILVS